MNWIITIVVLIVIGFILDREIYFYEGAHLGPRLQSWLYDRWSKQYDAGKRQSQLHDKEMLAEPLLEKLINVAEPFILDFATGSLELVAAPQPNTGEYRYNDTRCDAAGRIFTSSVSKAAKSPALDRSTNRLSSSLLPFHCSRSKRLRRS